MPSAYAAQFAGRWIGETQDHEGSAHVWDIRVNGESLTIESRWEHESRTTTMYGRMLPDQAAFSLGTFTALLIDSQHFIIPGWDTNDTRGGKGPAYDVVFSRPGLPELSAYDVWLRYKEEHGG